MNRFLAATIVGMSALLALPLAASAAPSVKCELKFQITGWSVFYKASDGTGTIKCSNGQSMNVKLKARGGGLSVGKSTIDDGHGEFSPVNSISDLVGSFLTFSA